MSKDHVFPLILLAIALWFSYLLGGYFERQSHFKVLVQKEREINNFKDQIRKKEKEHREREADIIDQFREFKKEYENNINNINDEYNSRLLEESNRASYYKRQYESSNCNNPELIDRTIQLDKSLNQGVSLVKELRETIILKDRTIDSLIKVIDNDRNTINGKQK